MIKVTRAHKVIIGFSTIALILKIVALASPGWFKLDYYVKPPIQDGLIPEDAVLRENGEPVAMAKRDTHDLERRHHHHHHRHHHRHHELVPGEKRVSISCGLFYFVTCVHGLTMEKERYHKCHHVSYCRAEKNARELPVEMRGVGLEEVYTNIGDVAKYGLMEIRVEVLVGVICAIIAVITGIRFVRNYFERRHAGVTTVICHIIAGVLFAVVVGKLSVAIVQVHFLLDNFYEYRADSTHLGFPFCLLLSGIAALFILTSSFFLLLTLSKGGRQSQAMPYIQTNTSGFGIISPPGYEPFRGLSDKKVLIKNEEEADKLPEKKPL